MATTNFNRQAAETLVNVLGGLARQIPGLMSGPTPVGVGAELGRMNGATPVGVGYELGQMAMGNTKAEASTAAPGMAPKPGGPTLDPVTDAVQKQVIKNTKAQVDEAMQMGVPAEHILAEQQKKAGMLTRIMGGATSFLGLDMNKGLINQGGYDENGQYQMPSKLFGLINPPAADQAALMQTYGIRPETALQYQTALTAAMMKNKGKLSDDEKRAQSAQSFGQNLVNMIDAYENLGMAKGPVGGNLAKMNPAGNQSVTEFNSMADALLYSAANHVAQQNNRSVSDRDIKILRGAFGLSNTSRETTVRGKVNALIKAANSLIPDGGAKLPPAEKLMDEIRNARKQQGSKSGSLSEGKLSSGLTWKKES